MQWARNIRPVVRKTCWMLWGRASPSSWVRKCDDFAEPSCDTISLTFSKDISNLYKPLFLSFTKKLWKRNNLYKPLFNRNHAHFFFVSSKSYEKETVHLHMRVGVCAIEQVSHEEFETLVRHVSKIKYFWENTGFFIYIVCFLIKPRQLFVNNDLTRRWLFIIISWWLVKSFFFQISRVI